MSRALQQWRDREERLSDLRSAIQVGIDEFSRGEGIRIESEEELDRLLDQIRETGRATIRERSAQSVLGHITVDMTRASRDNTEETMLGRG